MRDTCWCGAPMNEGQVGAWPYECKAKDKHPNHLVHLGCTAGHVCWSHSAPI